MVSGPPTPPGCNMTFALVSNPRTGSTAFANYFRDLGIFLNHEPFRPSKGPFRSYNLILKDIYETRWSGGMKHILTHTSYQHNRQILQWLIKYNIKIVGLCRRDLVLASLSLALAKQTNVWEIRREKGHGAEYDSVELESIGVQQLHATRARLSVYEEIFREFHNRVQVIYYEDFFNRPLSEIEANIDALLYVLKIKPPGYYKKLVKEHFSPGLKQNPYKIYERIPNWDEIKREFKIKES